MNTIIDFKTFGNYKEIESQNTLKKVAQMIESGMQQITSEDLKGMILNLGYKIDNSMCNVYYNNLNDLSYKAKGISYKDIKSGQSYAHFEQSFTNADNLEKLQKIRLNNFVFENGRIWEL